MLFTGKEILSRFKEHLERATRIHIATAWATQGKALNELEAAVQKKEKKGKKGLKVRAIVGTYGNTTDPAALECLHEFGELRLARGTMLFHPKFHPKIYVFEFRSGKPVAWVGSANFTGPGFEGGNVETMYETDDVKPFKDWFKQQWSQLEPATGEEINEYKERRGRNRPKRVLAKLVGEPEAAAPRPSLPPEAQTWKWKPVLRRKEIRRAFNQMRETLIDGADDNMNMVVGGSMLTVYWYVDLGYWCAFRDPDIPPREYWNPFGTENPEEANQLGSGCLQINPGHSQYGLFVRNRGDIFLARDLKGIRKGRGRVNPKKLEKGLKKRLPGSVVDVRWGDRTRRVVILGEVGSGELRYRVAELVRLVAELKGAGEAP